MEPGVDDVKKTLSGGVPLTKHAAGKSLSDKRIVFYHESAGKGYLAWQLVLNRERTRTCPPSSARGKGRDGKGRRWSERVC